MHNIGSLYVTFLRDDNVLGNMHALLCISVCYCLPCCYNAWSDNIVIIVMMMMVVMMTSTIMMLITLVTTITRTMMMMMRIIIIIIQ